MSRSSENIAAQAWEHLADAVAAAGTNARTNARTAGRRAQAAGETFGATADEAWRRANLAIDALAGRRPPLPWAWLLGGALAGLAIGFGAAAAARSLRDARAEQLTAPPAPTTERVHLDAP
jgi:hypothetical protein